MTTMLPGSLGVLAAMFAVAIVLVCADEEHEVFSFAPPFHLGRRSLRFWHTQGAVQAHEKTGLVLASPSPSSTTATGALWSKKVCSALPSTPGPLSLCTHKDLQQQQQPLPFDEWTATVVATARPGSGARAPGTGLALWYTRATQTGTLYGAQDRWDGLGVVLDTAERRVLVLHNDGTRAGGTLLGTCAASVPDAAQVRLRVSSDRAARTVRVDVALHPRARWMACWHGRVALPPLFKLGITARSSRAPFVVHSFTLGHSAEHTRVTAEAAAAGDEQARALEADETALLALAGDEKAADEATARLARAAAQLCHTALEVAAVARVDAPDEEEAAPVFADTTAEMVQSVDTAFRHAHAVLQARLAALEQHAAAAFAPLL